MTIRRDESGVGTEDAACRQEGVLLASGAVRLGVAPYRLPPACARVPQSIRLIQIKILHYTIYIFSLVKIFDTHLKSYVLEK